MAKKNKIEKISVVEQLAAFLKEDILKGTWGVGDKIPSESEIAEKYGVNRLSVRMALQKLNTLGVIETRVGEGSFVRDFSMYPLINQITDFYYRAERYEEIQDTRRLIERESISKACKLATADEIEELRESLDKYLESITLLSKDFSRENLSKTIKNDFAFHSQIVKMSHNQLLHEVYHMVQKLIRSHMAYLIEKRHSLPEYEYNDMTLDDHFDLFNKLCTGDELGARAALDRILDIQY